MIQVFSLAGYLTGSVDYFTYKRCTDITPKEVCGLDLHDGDKPVWNETGVYSTHLFTSRAEKIITDHAEQSPDKVGTVLAQHCMGMSMYYVCCSIPLRYLASQATKFQQFIHDQNGSFLVLLFKIILSLQRINQLFTVECVFSIIVPSLGLNLC